MPPFGCVTLYSMLDAEVFLRLQSLFPTKRVQLCLRPQWGTHREQNCDSLIFRLLCSYGEIAHCLNYRILNLIWKTLRKLVHFRLQVIGCTSAFSNCFHFSFNTYNSRSVYTTFIIQCVPLATETGISLIIVPLIRILQRLQQLGAPQTHSSSFLTQRTYSCSNFFAISALVFRIMKEMPGSVASGTHCIPNCWAPTCFDPIPGSSLGFYTKSK